MLSAARYPVRIGPMVLPPILPHSTLLYSVLRRTHTVLAYLLFFTFMVHLSTVLFHTLVLRDGLLRRMALSKARTDSAGDAVSRPSAGSEP
jgi:cytochrome b561